jgi:hypothetical protein
MNSFNPILRILLPLKSCPVATNPPMNNIINKPETALKKLPVTTVTNLTWLYPRVRFAK